MMVCDAVDVLADKKIVEWQDPIVTGATGWLVIDSLVNGVASGGTFMHKDATVTEVADLAKTMTYKNALQIPRIGGAKGGIRFDETHPDAKDVLKRFLIAQKEYIKNYWSTGADLNTDNHFIHHALKEELGLPSGFVSVGSMLSQYYNIPNKADIFLEQIGCPVNEYFNLGQSATGYSTAICIKQLCAAGSNIIIQGFGTIGKSLAYFIQTEQLGKIIGIIEKDWFLAAEKGIDIITLLKGIDNVALDNSNLILDKRLDNETAEAFLARSLAKSKANIFCPCATRYVITEKIADVLLNNTFCHNPLNYIISGANNVFANENVLQKLRTQKIIILPEWLSNSGNTLLFNEILKLTSNPNPIKLLSAIADRLCTFLSQLSRENIKGDLYERSCWLIKKMMGQLEAEVEYA